MRRLADNIASVVRFYVDGFRNMTIGKSLWTLIIIKLFIIFVILKIFFFPNKLNSEFGSDAERADAVRSALTEQPKSNINI